jgi:hypothetical protein
MGTQSGRNALAWTLAYEMYPAIGNFIVHAVKTSRHSSYEAPIQCHCKTKLMKYPHIRWPAIGARKTTPYRCFFQKACVPRSVYDEWTPIVESF